MKYTIRFSLYLEKNIKMTLRQKFFLYKNEAEQVYKLNLKYICIFLHIKPKMAIKFNKKNINFLFFPNYLKRRGNSGILYKIQIMTLIKYLYSFSYLVLKILLITKTFYIMFYFRKLKENNAYENIINLKNL